TPRRPGFEPAAQRLQQSCLHPRSIAMSVTSTMSRSTLGRPPAAANRPQGMAPQRQRVSTRPLTRNPQEPYVNVGEAERILSTIGGGALAVYGRTRGTLGGLGLAPLGGCW